MPGPRLLLARRIFEEKRRLIVPLVAGLAINAAIYAVAVYPLTVKVAGAHARAEAAARNLRAAETDYQTARGTQSGKQTADTQLQKFYRDVLPADLTGARRITYLRLAQLAEQTRLQPGRRSADPERLPGSRLTKLQMTIVLGGEYRDVRRFIYLLETSPEFVVIEGVSLAQAPESGAPLVLTLEASTYYVTGGHGS